jgi:hypothetical protein
MVTSDPSPSSPQPMAGGRSRERSLAASVLAAGVLACAAQACGHAHRSKAGAADGGSPEGDLVDAAIDGAADSSTGGDLDASGDEGAADDGGLAGDVASDGPPGDGPDDAELPIDGSVLLDAGCRVEIDRPAPLPGSHVPVGTVVQWNSNPPSSGPHFPIWAAFKAYDVAVPRGYYVHDLEHGAVVLLSNCGDAGCPDVVAALQAASDALPDDPSCTSLGEGVRVRTVITPDPLLDVPVAAAAWGWVYKAECVDLPSLRDFVLAHYGQGPEALCNNGQTQF